MLHDKRSHTSELVGVQQRRMQPVGPAEHMWPAPAAERMQ